MINVSKDTYLFGPLLIHSDLNIANLPAQWVVRRRDALTTL